MTWSLVTEFGLDYADTDRGLSHERLNYPALVERRSDGTTLIVDERFIGRFVSITAECRTLCVDRHGTLRYDSFRAGIRDGYGCDMDGGEMALLCRTGWRILILSDGGAIGDGIDLTAVSKGMPRLVSWTWRQTFLVAFVHRVGRIDIAELDRDGRLLWVLPSAEPALGFPGSIQLLPDGHVLVSDEYHHVAVELDRDGHWVWHFGTRSDSARDARCLSNPKAVRQADDGSRLIADTRNHRVLRVHGDGMEAIAPPDGSWSSPAFACATADDHVLVCDAGNQRVVELDRSGAVVWHYGHQVAGRRRLSFPRSVEVDGQGAYLVADTGNNRIVEVMDGVMRQVPVGDDVALFWPRCVRRGPKGHLIVADGRNSRILDLGPDGGLRRVLSEIRLDGMRPLGDPHDVRLLEDGHLLIADASANLVVETDWSGEVFWAAGDREGLELDDPHSAQRLPGGDVLVCDTMNSRIVRIDRSGALVQALEILRGPDQWYRLMRPRYADLAPDGVLVIADSDNSRLVAGSLDGTCLWALSRLPSRLETLSQPRWIQALSGSDVVVTDHLHHRVLHLRRTPG